MTTTAYPTTPEEIREWLLEEPARVAVALAQIAEPGDGDLGRVLDAAQGPKWSATVATNALVDLMFSPEVFVDEPLREHHLRELLARIKGRFNLEEIDRGVARLDLVGGWFLLPGSVGYPKQLHDLGPHKPRVIFGLGNKAMLQLRSVAIVGARAATSYGEHVTTTLAHDLSSRGFVVVSGGAYGIDGAAHRAVLANDGLTVAVLAGGIDRFYPTGHEQLLGRVAEKGAVISEVAPGTPPTKWRFLQRNRIIAALAEGTVVVEAGFRSGSLNTAAHTASLKRVLMAVPGPITSAASAGILQLLREYDAVAVGSCDDIFATLNKKVGEL